MGKIGEITLSNGNETVTMPAKIEIVESPPVQNKTITFVGKKPLTVKGLKEALEGVPDECEVMIGADCTVYYADHAEIEHDGFWIYGE